MEDVTVGSQDKDMLERIYESAVASAQRNIFSEILARCVVDGKMHHPLRIESICAALKPVPLQTGWMSHEPEKIAHSGKTTVSTFVPVEQIVCKRELVIGHGPETVVGKAKAERTL